MRLTPFWAGTGTSTCDACGHRLRWRAPLRWRLWCGSLLFKIGLLTPIVCLSAAVAFGGGWQLLNQYGIAIGFAIVVAGILLTRTMNPSAHIESF